ncbi:MAG TPA: metallophosphoesterase family protein [Gemmatimonadales bacterium]|nr:metallophosphoesterase family protein [Gemmatimonadales bacterium]
MFSQRLVVVGDAHIGRESPDTTAAFVAFLDTVPSLGDGLLVTGDLFEFWFAYDRVVPRHGITALAALAQVARRVPVLMLGGNHDQYAGTFWERELGIRFAPHEARFTLDGRPALALHGDGLTDTHWSARVLHRILRHDMTVALYRTMHPDLGMWLVDRLSGYLGDRERTEAEIQGGVARQAAWAEQRLSAEPGLRLVVMGHTHRAATRTSATGGLYLNPGAWFDGYRYAIVADGAAALHQFRPQ